MIIIRTVLIISAFILIFNSCNLSQTGYEGIEYMADSVYYNLRYNTLNTITSGYYQMEATDSSESILFTIIFPAYDINDIYSIPYDANTEIRYYDIDNNTVYRASSSEGSGMIIKETEPDSVFNQLSGTFEGRLINMNDETDTLFVSEGYFLFLF